MCETIGQGLWDLFITALGVWIGFIVAVRYEHKKAESEFNAKRKEVLKDLLVALKKNDQYLTQITDLHFQQGQLPTFPLDTVSLAYVALNARQYLPKGTNWGERYNGLRFELDHISLKTQLFSNASSILYPTGESHLLYDGKDGVLHNTIVQKLSSEFASLKTLIESTKRMLKTEIETLEKFA